MKYSLKQLMSEQVAPAPPPPAGQPPGGEAPAGQAPDAQAGGSDQAEQIEKLWGLPLPQFVKQLDQIVKDPKLSHFLLGGHKDGNPRDEIVAVKKASFAASALFPTQSEIDLSKSVKWPLSNPSKAVNILAGAAGTLGSPLVTANGKYVIDGHHRWSQVACLNPAATIDCIDITVGGGPEMILKMVHAVIAGVMKSVPSAEVKPGMNIYSMTFQQIVAAFASPQVPMGPDFVQACLGKLEVTASPEEIQLAKTLVPAAAAPAAPAPAPVAQAPAQAAAPAPAAAPLQEAKVAGADYPTQWSQTAATVAHNCKALPGPGHFARPIMPQSDDVGVDKIAQNLQAGMLNFKPAFDVKAESIKFDIDRWEILMAGRRPGKTLRKR